MRTRLAVLTVVALIASACTASATPLPTQAPSLTPSTAPIVSAAPSPTIAPTPTPVPVTVTIVTDFTIDASYGALLYGIQQGYFAQQGITLNLVEASGSSAAMPELDAKKVDFVFADMSTLIEDKAQNHTDGIGLMTWQNFPSIAIASLVPINNPQDMIGKTFGTVAFSSGRKTLPDVLKANGVDPAKVPIKLLDFSVLYQALFAGKIDTAETGIPGSGNALKVQAVTLSKTLYVKSLSDWGLKDYSKVLLTRTDVIQSDPDLVSRMVKAMDESLKQGLANMTDDQVVALMAKQSPQADPKAAISTWHDVKTLSVNNPGPFVPADVATILQRVVTDNAITTTLQATDLYTNQFIQPGS